MYVNNQHKDYSESRIFVKNVFYMNNINIEQYIANN